MGNWFSYHFKIHLLLTYVIGTQYNHSMKLLLLMSFLFISMKSFADTCKEFKLTDLPINEVKILPKSDLKRTFYKDTKQWFTVETREPARTNYDTTIIAGLTNEKLVRIFIQGPAQQYGVTTKWLDERTLAVDVEWGHALFCKYKVDLVKQKSWLVNQD